MADLAEIDDYYASQSIVTDPGTESGYLEGLPITVPGLQKVARGLVIHYRGERPVEQGVPRERMAEIDTRYASDMFARLAQLDQRPLAAERVAKDRLVGCCRDFTVLFLSMARSKGIACRARVGFADYFVAGHHVDHALAEVWDDDAERWYLVDPELGDNYTAPDGSRVNPLDVPRHRFLVGGLAWQLCRSGQKDPDSFVVDPGLELEQTRGWAYLRHNLVLDLAALNKAEAILWDSWGLLEREPHDPDDLALLDKVAALTGSRDPDLQQLRDLYEGEPDLRVPATVTSYDPLGGPPREVVLRG